MRRLLDFIRSLLHRKPVRLAIVRRYADANGSYVGELYMEQERDGLASFRMVGASLDTLPLLADGQSPETLDALGWTLDTGNDFLAPMVANVLRVGALEPRDNDSVRRMVASLPRGRIRLTVQNRFIEHVMEPKPAARDNDYE